VPIVQPNPNMIPADYDPLSDEPDEPLPIPPVEPPRISIPPETPPQRPTPPPATPIPAARPEVVVEPERIAPRETPAPAPVPRSDAADPGLVAVLQGAGLESAPVTAEFARSFGEIFRVVVAGVMDVLRARQQIKDEFRMRLTQFRAADNNPLKFSANVDDALHNLLVKRNAAYLEPVEAFEDAFDDLRDHQIAMLAGMRVAFESMLAHFNPDQLQEHFDRQLKRSALTSMTARLRYWELYRDRFEEMSKDTESTFRRLFGEEFAKAYEEQLKRLKADRRANAAILRPPDE
jgi:type VI secretion system FHA domain protein